MRTVQSTAFPKHPLISSVEVPARAAQAARIQSRVTVSDAALVTNVSLQTLVDGEAVHPSISIGKILQIADAIGLSLFAPLDVRRELHRIGLYQPPGWYSAVTA